MQLASLPSSNRVGNTHTLILFGVRGGRRPQERDPQDIALAREPVLGFGQYGNTITIFAEVRELHPYNNMAHNVILGASGETGSAHFVPADFELGRVPRCVLVRRPLDVAPWRFIRRNVTMNVERHLDCDMSARGATAYSLVAYISKTHGVRANLLQR